MMLSSTLTAVVMGYTLLILGLDVLLRGYGGARLWFNNVPVYTRIETHLQVNATVVEHCLGHRSFQHLHLKHQRENTLV